MKIKLTGKEKDGLCMMLVIQHLRFLYRLQYRFTLIILREKQGFHL